MPIYKLMSFHVLIIIGAPVRISLLLACFLSITPISSSVSAQSPHSPCDSKTRLDCANLVGEAFDSLDCDCLNQGHTDIEHGKANVVVDSVGWVVGIPRKIMIWDRRIDNHQVSSKTTSTVSTYLSDRRLHDVKLRVNQYDPVGEWKRLIQNKRMSPGWKYTAGVLRTAEYTILPGRIFGRDEYNPITNTVSIYSDAPVMGLAPSAYAFDVHRRASPGTYATFQSLPLIAMYHETIATKDVIDYTLAKGNFHSAEVRHILYARYGTEAGGEVGRFIPGSGTVFEVAGAIGGHSVAGLQSDKVRR